MGTEVLRPQDLLWIDRFGAPFHRRKQFPSNETVTVSRKQIHGGSPKKTSPKAEKRKKGSPVRSDVRVKDDGASGSPTMGQVTILGRRQPLDSVNGPKHMSPEVKQEEISPRRILAAPPSYLDGYAGSAFALSPSPQSLPLPSFFSTVVDVSATRDLRRLLRLE